MHNLIYLDFLWTMITCNVYGLCKGQMIPCLSQGSAANQLMDPNIVAIGIN